MAEAKGRREAVARVVMPVMATIASALAGYVARKGQQYLEETLMPRLRGSTDVGDVARDLADRAKARVPGIADDEAETRSSPSNDELVRLLRELRDRVELRVTAHYREQAILGEIVRDNPRVAKLREATQERAAQPLMLELGELVSAELQARTARNARAILERLLPLALAYEVDEEPIEHQVVRASFLVERKRLKAFDSAMDELAKAHEGRIDFKYVGPLPPHSFVGLTQEGRS